MDLAQRKLTRSEGDGIEIPANTEEQKILRMIKNGFNNTSIIVNDTLSLYGYMKIDDTPICFEKYKSLTKNIPLVSPIKNQRVQKLKKRILYELRILTVL